MRRRPCGPRRPAPRSSVRIQWMPSGSRPLTGSSSTSVCGSPSSADAMPSRWPMPSENAPARLRGDLVQPDQLEHLVHPPAREIRASARAPAGGWRALRPGWIDARLQQRADLGAAGAVVAVRLAVRPSPRPSSARPARRSSASSSTCPRRWGRGTRSRSRAGRERQSRPPRSSRRSASSIRSLRSSRAKLGARSRREQPPRG